MSERVLVLAPTAKDAGVCQHVMAVPGSLACRAKTLGAILRPGMEEGAGAAILTQESILSDRSRCLARALASQPAWSDFPLVVLTPGGNVSPRTSRELESVGHMTLIKRRVRIVELVQRDSHSPSRP